MEPGPSRRWRGRGVLQELELGRTLAEACEESGCDDRHRVRYAWESGNHMIPDERVEGIEGERSLEQAPTIRRPRRCRHSAANPATFPALLPSSERLKKGRRRGLFWINGSRLRPWFEQRRNRPQPNAIRHLGFEGLLLFYTSCVSLFFPLIFSGINYNHLQSSDIRAYKFQKIYRKVMIH